MFDLESALTEWRQLMLVAGIQAPVPLEELEIHLREDIEQQVRSGMSERDAFAVLLRQMGQAEILNAEFAKVRETTPERLQRFFRRCAGVPNHQLATNMNTNQDLEPGWATYLKAAAVIVPGVVVWAGFMVFVLPKLKQICEASGTTLWKPILAALGLSDFFKSNFIVISVVLISALILLEWRAHRWPRYRRPVLVIMAHTLSLLALILMATMAVFAVVAGAHLLPGK